jgi:hypothetical protein
LQKEISAQQTELEKLDKEAFIFFCNKAGNQSFKIIEAYQHYQKLSKAGDDYFEIANGIMGILRGFYAGSISVEQAAGDVATIKNNYEPQLKSALWKILDAKLITRESNAKLFNNINHFLQQDLVYFSDSRFQNEELDKLVQMLMRVPEELNDVRFRAYKEMLEVQLNP